MNRFGLACEGITDHITLENILCGYFDDEPDLDEAIIQLQPSLDETDKVQSGFGGWEMLLEYLQSTRFRDDVLNVEYVVVQLDTDIAEHANFDVAYRDDKGQELTVGQLIEAVINRLIMAIDTGEAGFYATHQHKIIFAICVHSLECWLYAYYNTKRLKNPKITGCGRALNYSFGVKGFDKPKEPKLYREHSTFFLTRKNIDIVAKKVPSFNYFIQRLGEIT